MVSSLVILDFGLFRVHDDGRVIGIPGYLLRLTDGRNVLVDTGFRAEYAFDQAATAAADKLGPFGEIVRLTEANLVAGQLALCGLSPADIDLLILTHTHIDHVGGIGHFEHVPIVIGASERALPTPLYWADQSPIAWPDASYQTIDAECELLPGLRLIPSPGHSPGHLSLLLSMSDGGSVLLTGDAISRSAEIATGFKGSWDPVAAQASATALLALAETSKAQIIYGHDPVQWPTLPKAPQTYC